MTVDEKKAVVEGGLKGVDAHYPVVSNLVTLFPDLNSA